MSNFDKYLRWFYKQTSEPLLLLFGGILGGLGFVLIEKSRIYALVLFIIIVMLAILHNFFFLPNIPYNNKFS